MQNLTQKEIIKQLWTMFKADNEISKDWFNQFEQQLIDHIESFEPIFYYTEQLQEFYNSQKFAIKYENSWV